MNEQINKIVSPNGLIEICEMPEGKLAGRVKIKMSSNIVHPDINEWNKNGLCWLEEYVLNNIESAKSMDYVVSWADEKNQIPSGHGDLSYDEDGNVIFENSVVVGSVKDASIEEVEIDNKKRKLLVTEGYINSQRYNLFVEWLKEQISKGKVHGSVEICGKGTSKKIEYLHGNKNSDGSLKVPRIPTVFDFSGLAILSSLEEPADDNSIVFELNSHKREDEKKMDIINKGATIELNKLSYDDIATLITRAINKAMGEPTYYGDYYIHRFYPTDSQIVFRKWQDIGIYYSTTYKVENSTVTIGEIIKVEENWKPTVDSQSVEINAQQIKEIIKGGNKMEEKDKKIEELNSQITEVNSKLKDSEAKNAELTSKVAEFETKINEINATLVEVNKSLEAVKAEKESLSTEVNSLKAYKDSKEMEVKKAEINAYFESEIPKNRFEESEVNSLKVFVENCDLEGLKNAEKDLVYKKFKESYVETNTTSFSFIATKNVDEQKANIDKLPKFFN